MDHRRSAAAALFSLALVLGAAPLRAQDGTLNPEEGGFGQLNEAIVKRPDKIGITCWAIYEVQKGGIHDQALDAMRACANAGNEPSMILLAHAYENGLGVPVNPTLATHWVKRAAERGYSTAAYHYGMALLDGRGTPRDEGQARFWLMQAAAGGDSDAARALSSWPSF